MSPTEPPIATAARALLKSLGYFVDVLWHVSDIREICEQNGWPMLSDSEAYAVFEELHAHFDGERGLNWPLLEEAVRRRAHARAATQTLPA